jgi:hypothetical protein
MAHRQRVQRRRYCVAAAEEHQSRLAAILEFSRDAIKKRRPGNAQTFIPGNSYILAWDSAPLLSDAYEASSIADELCGLIRMDRSEEPGRADPAL